MRARPAEAVTAIDVNVGDPTGQSFDWHMFEEKRYRAADQSQGCRR